MADESGSPSGSGAAAFLGRWCLLLLLAGHLLLRREFAHHNLGELVQLAGLTPPAILSHAYLTELTLILLLPLAWATVRQSLSGGAPPGEAALKFGLGPATLIALLAMLWCGGHALVGLFRPPHDLYLILRQSALGAYILVFVYTFIFFGNQTRYVRSAAVFMVLVAIACAGADMAHWLEPKAESVGLYPGEPLYGQQTLPLGILALGLFVVYADGNALLRGLALAAMGFIGWREARRVPQSVVILGMAGALTAYIALGAGLALRGQVNTLKRAILLSAFFGALFLGYRMVFKVDSTQRTEISSWRPKTYEDLFQVYDFTQAPAEPKMKSLRPPFDAVTDPEAYKLAAVYESAQRAGGVSVVNNIWRLLVWRRMEGDWQNGSPIVGAGVGNAWFYTALYQTRFHYGDEREGLDPHNSYLNFMYRYGAVGLLLLILLVGSVLLYVWKALRLQPMSGDVLLEGLALFFAYSAVFAFFTVSLEGPSYALPFWVSLGLMYAYARQKMALAKEALV